MRATSSPWLAVPLVCGLAAPAAAAPGDFLASTAGMAAAASETAKAPEGARWRTSREPMPFDIIRSLQFLQDQIARGNDRAIRVQALLLRRFGPVFLDAQAEAWADPRNRRAAVLFVLSGGPAAILDGLLKAGVLEDANRPLFEGALAYVRNDLGKARELLSGVDLSDMEPGLAGHIHLVLGQLLQGEDPTRAVAHLDRARLLVPGGLIEEAALRLGVLLVDGLGEHERADRLARQYFDRYSRSSYAGNFEARFVAVQAARGVADPAKAIATMADVINGLPDDRRQAVLLAVGRRALVEGNLAYAHLAAEAALAAGPASDPDRERARLYSVASTLSSREAGDAREALDALSRDRLHPEDIELLEAAYSVVEAIAAEAPPMPARPQAEAAGEAETASLPVFDRAERVLGQITNDLESAAR